MCRCFQELRRSPSFESRNLDGGRKHINLSDWLNHPPGRRASFLEQMYDEVSDGAMPLLPYLLMHSDASWTEDEKKAFLDWATAAQDSLMSGME